MNLKLSFAYEVNPFGGAVIETASLPSDSREFSRMLESTLRECSEKGLQLVWLDLPLERAELISPAVNQGFFYHHADERNLQLIFKISPEAHIPGYATHYIGVGGVLIDDQNRLLVIQERYHTHKHFKLPGGGVDPGEHLAAAAEREVLEETGIQSEFLSLHCFRHWHGYRYGKSDIYFVCRLKPLSSDITPDTREISKAEWMPVDVFLNDPDTHPFNRKIVETALSSPGLKLDSIPDYGSTETHEMMF